MQTIYCQSHSGDGEGKYMKVKAYKKPIIYTTILYIFREWIASPFYFKNL
jgi:hypothetical protein